MTPDAVYILRKPTLGIHSVDGQRIPVTIPMNARLQVLSRELNGSIFVEVEWEGNRLHMFAIDLRERGELVRF